MPSVLRTLMVLTFSMAIVLGLVVTAGADEPVTPSRSDLTAPVDVSANAQWVRLLEISFDAAEGERRKVAATVIGTVATSVPDTVLVLHAELRCGPADATSEPALLQVVNIWRGRTHALTPDFTYTAPATGLQSCGLWVRSGRPRPVAGAVGNQVTVLAGSFLLVDHVHAEVVEDFHPRAPSFLVDRRAHPQRTVSKLTWGAGSVPEDAATPQVVAVRGWISLTTCTTASGSNDPVQGKQLCTRGHRSSNGGTVLLSIRVDQIGASGRSCATTFVGGASGRYVSVSRLVHHTSRAYAANIALQPGCAPTLRVVTTLQWRSGASMMVHTQGTLLSAMPIDLQLRPERHQLV